MGTSSGTQTTQQQSTTQPWQPAIPNLQTILGNVQSLQGQSGINPTESAAIQQLTNNAGGIQNLSPQFQEAAHVFGGGDPFSVLRSGYNQYQNTLAPFTNPANLNPFNTPGFGGALNTLNQDITNQINGEFAGAGRSGSGYNTQTLARGLAQGEGSLLQNQYNQNVQNLMNAAGGLQQSGLSLNSAGSNNVGSGAALAGQIPQLATQGPGTLLNAGQVPFNLQAGNQGTLAGLTVPIAGLGGQEQGSSQTQSSYSPSLLQDIVGGAGAFSNIFNPFSGGANSGILGAGKFFGGLFGSA